MKNFEITSKKRIAIFLNIMIACSATGMLATALATALLPIAQDFGVSITTGQWLTSAYSLVLGIIVPLTAFLIARFPTKKLYLTGSGIFVVGSLVCAIATNFPFMMVGRILQACGEGVIISMGQVVLLTIYPKEKKGTIMGWYGLAIGAAPVIAPTLAGILVDSIGWRSIFYIAFAIMLAAVICAVFVFDDVLETKSKKFDALSFILTIFAFGGITLGIGNTGNYSLRDIQVWAPLIIGIITAFFFAHRQLHIGEPLLELRILKNKEFALSVIGSMLLYFVMMASTVILPLYVQSIMGYSATVAGLVTLPGSLAMAIISPFAGKFFDKVGMKKLCTAGALFLVISNIGMYFVTMNTPIYVAAIFNVLRCIAIGFLLMPFVTWGTMHVENTFVADASALINSLRTTAGAIGSAVFVGVMSMVINNSTAVYGENAGIHGVNITYAIMSVVTLFLLVMAVFLIKPESKNEK